MKKIIKKDIIYFQSLSYDVIVRKKGQFCVLLLPELSIIVQDESLDKAYAKLETEKEAYFRRMIDVSMENYISEPQNKISDERLLNKLLPFFIKLIVISLSIVIFTTVAFEFARLKIDVIKYYAVTQIRHFILKDINEMPDDKRQRIRTQLHKAVTQIKPFVDEITILFIDTPDNEVNYPLSENK